MNVDQMLMVMAFAISVLALLVSTAAMLVLVAAMRRQERTIIQNRKDNDHG